MRQENKFNLIFVVSAVICFLANIILKNNIWVAVSNSVIFCLSILLVNKLNPIFLPILALAPIFNFDIKQIQINFLLIAFLGLIFLAKKISIGKNLIILIILGLLFGEICWGQK